MSVRRLFAGVAATAVAATTLGALSPAHADPSYAPLEADIVGAGSDTTQFVLDYLADGNAGIEGYNTGRTAGRIANFHAIIPSDPNQPKTVVLRQGAEAVARPNGSGGGKRLLYGTNNNTHVDFARSSGSMNATEREAGLQQFPFAKDTLGMAVSANSNAPTGLTNEQLIKIYTGEIKNWSEVGGKPGVINVLIPQPDSGTGSFFASELAKINAGNTVTLATSITAVQEHDPAPLLNDPNAVAPFSAGRAGLNDGLRILDGFAPGRALYNVVRGTDVEKKEIQDIFGANGFVCSPEAAALIANAGFEQLLSSTDGGSCGVASQNNLGAADLVTSKVPSTTAVVANKAEAGVLDVTATIGGGGALVAQGTVEFYLDGATTPARTVLVTGGKASLKLTGQKAGNVSVKAVFVPNEGSAFSASESTVSAVVAAPAVKPVPKPVVATSKIKESFKATNAKGKRARGTVTVTLSNKKRAVGRVVIKDGRKVVANAALRGGKATVTLKKLAKGKRTLVATYTVAKGTKNVKGSTLRFTIRQR